MFMFFYSVGSPSRLYGVGRVFLCEILDWFEPRRLAPENFQKHLIAFLVPFRTPSAVPSLPRFQEVPNSPVNFQKSLIRRDYVLRVLAESEWEAVKLKS